MAGKPIKSSGLPIPPAGWSEARRSRISPDSGSFAAIGRGPCLRTAHRYALWMPERPAHVRDKPVDGFAAGVLARPVFEGGASGGVLDGTASAGVLMGTASEMRVDGIPAARLRALAELRDRAILATDIAFTITDPFQPDNPLLWVNPAFTRVTGYTFDECVGHNCRFLQGPGTDAGQVQHLQQEIAALRPVMVTILNYRKDGTAFWNEIAVNPVFDTDGDLVSFVGVQSDVTERVRAQDERERGFAAERAARRDAEASRLRLGLLAEATTQLAATLDVDETLERLADLIVPYPAGLAGNRGLRRDRRAYDRPAAD